jgi:hypothetical protein
MTSLFFSLGITYQHFFLLKLTITYSIIVFTKKHNNVSENPICLFGNHLFELTNIMISEIYFLGSRWQHLLKAALPPAFLDYPRSSPLIPGSHWE